jgi:outer membrane protein TolC
VLLAEDAVLAERRIVADLESRALTLDIALIRALGGGFTA